MDFLHREESLNWKMCVILCMLYAQAPAQHLIKGPSIKSVQAAFVLKAQKSPSLTVCTEAAAACCIDLSSKTAVRRLWLFIPRSTLQSHLRTGYLCIPICTHPSEELTCAAKGLQIEILIPQGPKSGIIMQTDSRHPLFPLLPQTHILGFRGPLKQGTLCARWWVPATTHPSAAILLFSFLLL